MAQWLLANNFLLSALELLVEAQEAGKESEVERLSEFFADHAKFPPEEVAKFGARDGESAFCILHRPGILAHRAATQCCG